MNSCSTTLIAEADPGGGGGIGWLASPLFGSFKLEIKKMNKTIMEATLSLIVPILFCQVGYPTPLPIQKSWIPHQIESLAATFFWLLFYSLYLWRGTEPNGFALDEEELPPLPRVRSYSCRRLGLLNML